MFKNYLTYQFAVNFERGCNIVEIQNPFKADLQHCATAMLNYFTRSIQTQDKVERSKSLFVALTYLRDCKQTLEQSGIKDLDAKYEILNLRLEHLCEEACKAEGGQFRMLG